MTALALSGAFCCSLTLSVIIRPFSHVLMPIVLSGKLLILLQSAWQSQQ